MPDKKISELVNLTSLATDDEFVVVDADANATKRITATNLSKFPAGVTVPDAGTIGSASDPDAMAISSGGVVTFSQGLSFGADTLDDYEEGTWTSQIADAASGGNVSSTTDTGVYTKVGNIVHVNIVIGNVDTSGMTSGNDVYIRGLPFTVGANTHQFAIRTDDVTYPSGRTYVVATAISGTNHLIVSACGSNISDVPITVGNINSGAADFIFSGVYATS